jgi:hypothetical protein
MNHCELFVKSDGENDGHRVASNVSVRSLPNELSSPTI